LILLDVLLAGVYNQNTVGKHSNFQPIHAKISCKW